MKNNSMREFNIPEPLENKGKYDQEKKTYSGYRRYKYPDFCFYDCIKRNEKVDAIIEDSIFYEKSAKRTINKQKQEPIQSITLMKKNENDCFIMIVQPEKEDLKKALVAEKIEHEINEESKDSTCLKSKSERSVAQKKLIIFLKTKDQIYHVTSLIGEKTKLPPTLFYADRV